MRIGGRPTLKETFELCSVGSSLRRRLYPKIILPADGIALQSPSIFPIVESRILYHVGHISRMFFRSPRELKVEHCLFQSCRSRFHFLQSSGCILIHFVIFSILRISGLIGTLQPLFQHTLCQEDFVSFRSHKPPIQLGFFITGCFRIDKGVHSGTGLIHQTYIFCRMLGIQSVSRVVIAYLNPVISITHRTNLPQHMSLFVMVYAKRIVRRAIIKFVATGITFPVPHGETPPLGIGILLIGFGTVTQFIIGIIGQIQLLSLVSHNYLCPPIMIIIAARYKLLGSHMVNIIHAPSGSVCIQIRFYKIRNRIFPLCCPQRQSRRSCTTKCHHCK